MSQFGNYLKAQRTKRKLSLRQLAEKTGVGYTRLHRFETGRLSTPTIDDFKKIAKGLRLTIRGVIRGVGASPQEPAANGRSKAAAAGGASI